MVNFRQMGSLLDARERCVDFEYACKVLGALRSEVVPADTANTVQSSFRVLTLSADGAGLPDLDNCAVVCEHICDELRALRFDVAR